MSCGRKRGQLAGLNPASIGARGDVADDDVMAVRMNGENGAAWVVAFGFVRYQLASTALENRFVVSSLLPSLATWHRDIHMILQCVDHGHDQSYIGTMPSVSKSALKARMLEYFRLVEQTGEELIVLDNNRPVLKVVPIRERQTAQSLFADVRGRVAYHDDVLAPTTEEWGET